MISSQLVASTTVPAFSVDANAKVLAWNCGAEHLFGHKQSDVLGRNCWDVLAGYDLFGNEYCSAHCPLLAMAKSHKAINRCELCFQAAEGNHVNVGVSTMSFSGKTASELMIVHLLTPIASHHVRPVCGLLTKRECDVLRILGDGKQTTEIGKRLNVSEATVRNHIQKIFRKLDVHTRLEAVCIAWRMGLLENANDSEDS